MIEKMFAEKFATEWVSSWNKHNLDLVLAHYRDDFEMFSPVIVQIMGEPLGVLKGKEAVSKYWTRALQLFPDLHFELLAIFVGVQSITLSYKSIKGRLACEVFHFDSELKVIRADAHYVT